MNKAHGALLLFGAAACGDPAPSELQILCEDSCLQDVFCGFYLSAGPDKTAGADGVPACADDCRQRIARQPPDCRAALQENLECVVGLQCGEVEAFGTEAFPCQPTHDASLQACTGEQD